MNLLFLINLLVLAVLMMYLASKVRLHPAVFYLLLTALPLGAFEIGSHLFMTSSHPHSGAALIVFGIALIPIGITPLSHKLGRFQEENRSVAWMIYYSAQALFLVLVIKEISNETLIEWVTGILDQPFIIVEKSRRFLFLNVLLSSGLALFCFDNTLRNASGPQLEALKFVFIAFVGFIVYFFYLSFNILVSSYISGAMLQSGAAVIFLGLVSLAYAFARYPFWEVKINVSRRIVFGCLSLTAAIIYLVISGTLLDLLRLLQPQGYHTLLPAAVFALVAGFLAIYLSPNFRKSAESFVTRNFFKNKYDYRDLWMKFSEKSSGALNIKDVLPKVAEFISDAMFVRQVAVWLRSAASESFFLAYCHDSMAAARTSELPSLHLDEGLTAADLNGVHTLSADDARPENPVVNLEALKKLGVNRFVLVEKDHEVLAVLGVGAEAGGKQSSKEDDQLLLSLSNQLAHLILTHKLSEELLLAREWESFNRFASFILHDLKNLATLQSMTLENAKRHGANPQFLADAFATFTQTTEKMINLIAGLSVQRGQFSLKQQPVNILEVIAAIFDDLRLDQRAGVKVIKSFPPQEKVPLISGDPDLLRKAFTNLLLNAIQSLPRGEGAVEITVSPPTNGKIMTEIKDTGCGISPEQLQSLFRPFQTTKKQGMGIGLCHTRSIVEVHGGQIRIESQVNAGTKVEVEFPTL